jgi:enoyl-CoA hydratase/carnithine racemase
MMQVVKSPKPVIAEVAGLASAAGCQLVATCDLAVAADTARFCTPGVNIGLFCSTPMVALARNLSTKHAMEMLLTGDIFDAQEAYRMGLVNRVVPANALSETVSGLAGKIASKSMATVRTGKHAFYRQLDLPLEEAYAYTARVMTENLLQRDAEEGISAFIGKRPPQWTDEP